MIAGGSRGLRSLVVLVVVMLSAFKAHGVVPRTAFSRRIFISKGTLAAVAVSIATDEGNILL